MRFVLALLVGLACAAAQAQPARVRGTVSGFDGKVLSVKEAGGAAIKIQVQEKTEIVFTQPITLADIKPGDFLGVTSMKRPDGTLTAYEVRRFPKPLNPGHRPFDGRDDQTMTNATVGAMVQATSGRELTMTYEGGSQKIVVPENASISALVPGTPKQLVPGAPVNLTHDASNVALRIQVGPPKL
jgi:uncharacterized surface protein with fasciclin (FAS1) repeats